MSLDQLASSSIRQRATCVAHVNSQRAVLRDVSSSVVVSVLTTLSYYRRRQVRRVIWSRATVAQLHSRPTDGTVRVSWRCAIAALRSRVRLRLARENNYV